MSGAPSSLRATPAEVRALEKLARARSRAESDRARIILLTLQGRSSTAIAEALGTSAGRVRNLRMVFQDGGVEALRAKVHPGRAPVVGPAAMAIAREIIAETGEKAWTVGRLRDEVARRGGPQISVSQLRRELKKGGSHIVGRATRSRKGKTWMRADGLPGAFAA